MQIHAVMGYNKKSERDVDNFCSWIEVQVMTELIGALPTDKQGQVIDQFIALPPDKKESVFYPYYTVEFMQGRVKKATKAAILQQIIEPHWDTLLPSQQEVILSLLEEFER
jgi:hypothetical protein